MSNQLVGDNLRFAIGEPWDFHRFNPIENSIGEVTSVVRAERDWITVKWSFRYEGKEYLHGILRNRLEGFDNSIDWLLRGKDIGCNMKFFVVGSQIGAELAQMNKEGLDRIRNQPHTAETIGLIGAVQLASVSPLAWER